MNSYDLRLLGVSMMVLGALLAIEHCYRWGIDLYDFPFGHEWYGLALFLGGWGVGVIAKRRM